MRKFLLTLLAVGLLAAPAFSMGDRDLDPGMKAEIQKAMRKHIVEHQVDGSYVIYDSLAGGFKHLSFKELHPGVVRMSGFYVSCIDFVAEDGTLYDVDFMVSEGPDGYTVYRDVIHAVNGQKRAYHRERAS